MASLPAVPPAVPPALLPVAFSSGRVLLVVTVCGIPGSGKSTIANAISKICNEELRNVRCEVISFDRFELVRGKWDEASFALSRQEAMAYFETALRSRSDEKGVRLVSKQPVCSEQITTDAFNDCNVDGSPNKAPSYNNTNGNSNSDSDSNESDKAVDVIVLDDTMHLTSMRREVFGKCKAFKALNIIVYVSSSSSSSIISLLSSVVTPNKKPYGSDEAQSLAGPNTNNAVERNAKRDALTIVSDKSMDKIIASFEIPPLSCDSPSQLLHSMYLSRNKSNSSSKNKSGSSINNNNNGSSSCSSSSMNELSPTSPSGSIQSHQLKSKHENFTFFEKLTYCIVNKDIVISADITSSDEKRDNCDAIEKAIFDSCRTLIVSNIETWKLASDLFKKHLLAEEAWAKERTKQREESARQEGFLARADLSLRHATSEAMAKCRIQNPALSSGCGIDTSNTEGFIDVGLYVTPAILSAAKALSLKYLRRFALVMPAKINDGNPDEYNNKYDSNNSSSSSSSSSELEAVPDFDSLHSLFELEHERDVFKDLIRHTNNSLAAATDIPTSIPGADKGIVPRFGWMGVIFAVYTLSKMASDHNIAAQSNKQYLEIFRQIFL